MRVAASTLLTFLLLAPAALAHDGGQGWIGESDDVQVTNAGFILIAFFPLFVFAMSMLQSRLDKRKYARRAAAKSIAGDKRGGW